MYVSYLKLRSHQSAWLMFLWCLLMGVCLFALPAKVHAVSIFEVNLTVFDAEDMNPGDGVCQISPSADSCTLRAAVMEANATPGADIITLPKGANIKLDKQFSVMDGTGGKLRVTESLSIVYGGSNKQDFPLIDASGLDDTIFYVDEGIFNLLRVRMKGGGKNTGPGILGGALFVGGSDTKATLTEVELFANTAKAGGAIFNAGAELLIVDSSIHNNGVTESGGAIQNSCGETTLERTSVYQNINFGVDGESLRNRKYNADSSGECRLTLLNTTVTQSSGAGILNEGGSLSLKSSTIAKNSGVGVRATGSPGDDAQGFVRMRNTVIAEHGMGNCNFSGSSLNIHGYNASDDDSCELATNSLDIVEDDLNLNSIVVDEDDWHHYFLPGPLSPIVDRGHTGTGGFGCLEEDQLGNPRPKQGSLLGSERCDIGSIERQNFLPPTLPSVIFQDGFETQDGD